MTATEVQTRTVQVPASLADRLNHTGKTRDIEETILTGTIVEIQYGPRRVATVAPAEGTTDDTITLAGGYVIDLGWTGLRRLALDPDTFLHPPVEGVPERLIGQRVTVTLRDGALHHVAQASEEA